MNIKKYIKDLFVKPKPIPKQERGFLFVSDNIRKVKGEERNNIKNTLRNYMGDGILTRLITSKATQIKDESIKKCYEAIERSGSVVEGSIKAGLIMVGSVNKIKGLEALVEEIRFFAKKDVGSEPAENPHEHV